MNSLKACYRDLGWHVRTNILSAAAAVGTGALINYDNPKAYAISYAARQVFSKSWFACLKSLDCSWNRAIRRVFPKDDCKAILNHAARDVVVSLAAGAGIVLPFVFADQLCKQIGYPLSPLWMVAGAAAGGCAHTATPVACQIFDVLQTLHTIPFKSDLLTVTEENFQKEVIESELPVVVSAYTNWSFPCLFMSRVFSDISDKLDGQMKFAKLRIDQNGDLAKKYNIRSAPTLLVFKNGELSASHTGEMPKEMLLSLLSPQD